MTILRAYRVRLEPTIEQRKILGRSVGMARFTYNWALREWRQQYRAFRLAKKAPLRALALLKRWQSQRANDPRWTDPPGRSPTWMSLHKLLVSIRADAAPWLATAPSHAIREAVHDVGSAYEAFFRRVKKHASGDHSECGGPPCRLGAPRFRRRTSAAGQALHMDEGKALAVRPDAVRLQKIGWIKITPHQRGFLPFASYDPETKTWAGAKICGIGVRSHLGHWHASIRMQVAKPENKPRTVGKRLGVEVGLRALVVTSDGNAILDKRAGSVLTERARGAIESHDRRLQSAERRLALWQRRAARRHREGIATQDQSRGWNEAQNHVRRLYAEISNLRDELLHYASRRIVDSGAQTIVMRKPTVKQMIGRAAAKQSEQMGARNVLAPAISQIGWYELVRKVEYKARWAGAELVQVSSDCPTSRRCSRCGAERDSAPSYPDFVCPACGHREDRDTNSAKALQSFCLSSDGSDGTGRTARTKTTNGRKSGRGTTARTTGLSDQEASALRSDPDRDETSPLGSGNGARGAQAPRETGE